MGQTRTWKHDKITNQDCPEPYRIPGCRCQKALDEIEPEERFDTGLYTKGDLTHDLSIFVNYLPESEIRRIVECAFWCLSTAMKDRGGLDIKDFARITTLEKDMPDSTVAVKDKFGVPQQVPKAKKKRYIKFSMYPQLKSLICPRTKDFFPGHERTFYIDRVSATNHPYFYAKHWRRGALLLQSVFDKTFEYTGYTDEYISMAEQGIITPFGKERQHGNRSFNTGFEAPPYVKAAYTDEIIDVPLTFVGEKYFNHPEIKRLLMTAKYPTEEARKDLKVSRPE